ncbi:MAG TPA: glycosyltransferase family 39 protein, partial [Acidobacteriota bacterium]
LLIGNLIFNRDLFSKRISPGNLKNTPKTFVAAALLIASVLFLYGFYALGPETFYDALVYHLALPQLYKITGGFVATPHNSYSGLPFLMQMLYTWALFISDEILARLIHWSTGAGLAIGFLGLCLRYKRPALASLLACAFLTTPILGLNVSVSGVDVASSFMVFLAVYALSISFDENQDRWEILSATFCGFALSLKYTNWPLLPIIVAAFLFIRRDAKKSVRFAMIAVLLVAPCVIRNFLFYGNPIYPYFHEWFQQDPLYAVDWKSFQREAWGRQWDSTLTEPKQLGEAILQPFVVTYRGSSSVEYIGPLFLAALPLIFFRRADDRHRIWLIVFVGLWLSWWLTTTMPRYFLPGLAILAACFCLRFPHYSQKWIRWGLAVVMVTTILHNTAGFSLFAHTDTWNYLIFGQSK